MKRTVILSLRPTAGQRAALQETMRAFNAACQYISAEAWAAQEFRRVPIHKLTHYAVRAHFGLPSQLAVRAIGVVADSYKADRTRKHLFGQRSAVIYDDRLCKIGAMTVAMHTLGQVRQGQRRTHSNWAYHQFTQFLAYKCAECAERGVPFVLVDPRRTSQTCSRCGHCEKANRSSQSSFLCRRCGFAAHADVNGAQNGSERGYRSTTRTSGATVGVACGQASGFSRGLLTFKWDVEGHGITCSDPAPTCPRHGRSHTAWLDGVW